VQDEEIRHGEDLFGFQINSRLAKNWELLGLMELVFKNWELLEYQKNTSLEHLRKNDVH
jgi:hypothetical protein